MNLFQEQSFYPFVLDHKPGFFLSWFLYTLFKRVQFDENMIEDLKQMRRQGTVVYAIKYRSHLDYLLYHYRFRRSRLPYPKVAFNLNMSMVLPLSQLTKILKFHLTYFLAHGRLPSPYKTGFLEKTIQNKTTSLISLVDPKGFKRHFVHAEKDPLHFLLETQKDMDQPIYIIPQLILYKKAPEKDYSSLLDIFFGFREKPGFIRKIALFFRHHRRAFIDFGRPLDLKAYLEGGPATRSLEEMAVEIKRLLIGNIDRQKRIILGPVMKSRQQLKERVLKDQDITEIIEKMAGGNGRRLIQLRKKAGEYFDEIAADYNIAYIEFFNTVLTWLWKRIFQGIDVDPAELAVVREWAGKGPVIYIPSHKSHIDYLIFTYVLYQHHMHNPRIAAGKNLAFWPMGHIFRKCGAFFIRRTLKGARLYSKVFAGYVKALLQEGYPIEFFIEGGRSRSGKLIIPKIGFLSILLEAYRTGCCNDLVFVPASISYDRVIEEEAYIKELEGGEKVKESPKGLFGARHFLKKKYGKIYIRFGEIFSLNEFLAQRGDLEAGLHRDLAFHLIRSINKVTMVTPLALVALAILTAHRRGFHVQELTSTVEALLSFLERYEVPTATSLNNFQKTVEETLLLLTNRKVVNFLEDVDGAETFYYVDDEKKRELEYYKNSIIHYFICHAFVAVSLLTATDERKTEESILSDYGFLKRLFRKEFVYDEEKDAREEIDRVTTYFSDASLLTRSDTDGGYKLTRPGYNTLPIWAALTKTFLESYWIATRSFIQRKDKPRKSGDLLKNMNYLGLRFHKLGLIDHMEAVSQVTFKNAIPVIEEYISEGQDKSEEDGRDAWERLSRLSQRLYDFSHYRRIR